MKPHFKGHDEMNDLRLGWGLRLEQILWKAGSLLCHIRYMYTIKNPAFLSSLQIVSYFENLSIRVRLHHDIPAVLYLALCFL